MPKNIPDPDTIPTSLTRLFQEYDFASMNVITHAKIIIERTLELGTWQAWTPEIQQQFHLLTKLPFIAEFYLGGGTGLALQIGQLYSIDLNFFSDSSQAAGESQRRIIIAMIKSDPSFKLTWDKDGTFVATWQNVGLSFFRLDQHPLIKPPILINEIQISTIGEIVGNKIIRFIRNSLIIF